MLRKGKSKARKTARLSLKRHDMGLKTGDRANRRWKGRGKKGKPGLKRLGQLQRDQYER